MASVDLSDVQASLKARKEKNKDLMIKRIVNGWGQLAGFKIMRVINEIVLGSLTFKSLMQPGGKGTFNPKANAVKVEARIGKVRPAKIDLLITEIERDELQATYFAEVEGKDGRDPEDFLFADHIWEHVIEQAGVDTLQAVWVGHLNSAGTNAVDVCDGIVTLIDKDIVSGDIAEDMILEHAAEFFLTESNIIKEFKDMVKIFRNRLPAYAFQPATLRCAPERRSDYEFALEQLNGEKNTYNSFGQPLLYFAKNIKIQEEPSLAGLDFVSITPDGNLIFMSDRNDTTTKLDSDYNVRDRSVALVSDWKFAPNYFRSDLWVVNDLRARPVNAGF